MFKKFFLVTLALLSLNSNAGWFAGKQLEGGGGAQQEESPAAPDLGQFYAIQGLKREPLTKLEVEPVVKEMWQKAKAGAEWERSLVEDRVQPVVEEMWQVAKRDADHRFASGQGYDLLTGGGFDYEYIFGNLKPELVEVLKTDDGAVALSRKLSEYFPSSASPVEKGAFIESVLRGAVISSDLMSAAAAGAGLVGCAGQSPADKARDLFNFLFAVVTVKGQQFEEGALMIYGPQARAYFDFLIAAGGALRMSSHFKGHGLDQYGLDVEGLPEGKGHLLFALFNGGDALFIKPENYGVEGVYNVAMHGLELVVAQARKPALQKWLPQLALLVGTDQQEGYRKERIPASVIRRFVTILDNLNLDPTAFEIELEEVSKMGIQKIYHSLIALRNAGRGDLDAINEFIQELEGKYDNLRLRFGEEVILKRRNLNIFSPELIDQIRAALCG